MKENLALLIGELNEAWLRKESKEKIFGLISEINRSLTGKHVRNWLDGFHWLSPIPLPNFGEKIPEYDDTPKKTTVIIPQRILSVMGCLLLVKACENYMLAADKTTLPTSLAELQSKDWVISRQYLEEFGFKDAEVQYALRLLPKPTPLQGQKEPPLLDKLIELGFPRHELIIGGFSSQQISQAIARLYIHVKQESEIARQNFFTTYIENGFTYAELTGNKQGDACVQIIESAIVKYLGLFTQSDPMYSEDIVPRKIDSVNRFNLLKRQGFLTTSLLEKLQSIGAQNATDSTTIDTLLVKLTQYGVTKKYLRSIFKKHKQALRAALQRIPASPASIQVDAVAASTTDPADPASQLRKTWTSPNRHTIFGNIMPNSIDQQEFQQQKINSLFAESTTCWDKENLNWLTDKNQKNQLILAMLDALHSHSDQKVFAINVICSLLARIMQAIRDQAIRDSRGSIVYRRRLKMEFVNLLTSSDGQRLMRELTADQTALQQALQQFSLTVPDVAAGDLYHQRAACFDAIKPLLLGLAAAAPNYPRIRITHLTNLSVSDVTSDNHPFIANVINAYDQLVAMKDAWNHGGIPFSGAREIYSWAGCDLESTCYNAVDTADGFVMACNRDTKLLRKNLLHAQKKLIEKTSPHNLLAMYKRYKDSANKGSADKDSADKGSADKDSADKGSADKGSADKGSADTSDAAINSLSNTILHYFMEKSGNFAIMPYGFYQKSRETQAASTSSQTTETPEQIRKQRTRDILPFFTGMLCPLLKIPQEALNATCVKKSLLLAYVRYLNYEQGTTIDSFPKNINDQITSHLTAIFPLLKANISETIENMFGSCTFFHSKHNKLSTIASNMTAVYDLTQSISSVFNFQDYCQILFGIVMNNCGEKDGKKNAEKLLIRLLVAIGMSTNKENMEQNNRIIKAIFDAYKNIGVARGSRLESVLSQANGSLKKHNVAIKQDGEAYVVSALSPPTAPSAKT